MSKCAPQSRGPPRSNGPLHSTVPFSQLVPPTSLYWSYSSCFLFGDSSCFFLVLFLARPFIPISHSRFGPSCISLIGLYWFCSHRHKTTRPHFVYQLEVWVEWLYSQPRYHALLYSRKNTGNLSQILHNFTEIICKRISISISSAKITKMSLLEPYMCIWLHAMSIYTGPRKN